MYPSSSWLRIKNKEKEIDCFSEDKHGMKKWLGKHLVSMKKKILSKSVLISINKIEQDLLLNVKEIIEVFIQLIIAFVIKCSDGVTIIIA